MSLFPSNTTFTVLPIPQISHCPLTLPQIRLSQGLPSNTTFTPPRNPSRTALTVHQPTLPQIRLSQVLPSNTTSMLLPNTSHTILLLILKSLKIKGLFFSIICRGTTIILVSENPRIYPPPILTPSFLAKKGTIVYSES